MLYVQSSLYLSNRITETRISIKISKSRKNNKKVKLAKKNTTFIWMELLNLSGMLIFSHVLLCFSSFPILIVQHCNVRSYRTHNKDTYSTKESFFCQAPFTYIGLCIAWNVFILQTRLQIDYLSTVKMWEKNFKKRKWIKKASTKSTSNNIWTDFLSFFFPPHCIPNCISPHIL